MPRHSRAQSSSEAVVVGFIHGDNIDARHVASVRQLYRYDATTAQRILLGGDLDLTTGPRIASARNMQVHAFLRMASAPQWLLSLDSDIVVPPDLLDRLFTHADARERPFVSGLYFLGGRGAHVIPAMYTVTKREDGGVDSVPIWDFPEGALVSCDVVGAGCTLIHRNVYLAVADKWGSRTAYPWFAEAEYGGEEFGEDFTFSMRVRNLGIPVYCDTGTQLGHRKMFTLGMKDYRAQQRREAEGSQESYEAEEHQAASPGNRLMVVDPWEVGTDSDDPFAAMRGIA